MHCKSSLKNTKYWKETAALKVYYVTFTVFQDVACINIIFRRNFMNLSRIKRIILFSTVYSQNIQKLRTGLHLKGEFTILKSEFELCLWTLKLHGQNTLFRNVFIILIVKSKFFYLNSCN